MASDFLVHELDAGVRVRVSREMPALPATLEAEVEELWRSAVARVAANGAGQLFNGRVFSADVITADEITGHLTEFRRIVAQMERPALHDALGIRSLAVCGVVYCADGVVFGRRHAGAVYQAAMWQLPPAGSVDAHAVRADGAVELRVQLLDELAEELGLQPGDVGEARPLCIVEHPDSHVLDLGMFLPCRLDGPAIRAAHAACGSREYSTLHIVPVDQLPTFVTECGDSIVPPAAVFLTRAGLLTRQTGSAVQMPQP